VLKELHRRLRPMGFADILDEAMDLYKKNFVLLSGIGVVLYVPLALLQFANPSPSPGMMESHPSVIVGYVLRTVAVASIYWLAAMIVTAALTFATSEIYLGRKPTVMGCYRRIAGSRVLISFLWANILWGLAALGACIPPFFLFGLGGVSIGFQGGGLGAGTWVGILLIVLGLGALVIPVYVTTRLVLYTPAFFVENPGAAASLNRSWTLLKGKVLITFGLLTVVSVVVGIITGIILSPFYIPIMMASMKGTEPSPIVMTLYTLTASALSALTLPIKAMVVILIYYDARIRNEGFDLEMLAADMGQRIERVMGQGPPPLPQEVTQQVPSPEVPPAAEQQE
jgi:hypothetical protein